VGHMAAVGFTCTRGCWRRSGGEAAGNSEPVKEAPQESQDLPVRISRRPVPDEAQVDFGRLARSRPATSPRCRRSRLRPVPAPVLRLVGRSCGSRQVGGRRACREGWLVVRFGAGLSARGALSPRRVGRRSAGRRPGDDVRLEPGADPPSAIARSGPYGRRPPRSGAHGGACDRRAMIGPRNGGPYGTSPSRGPIHRLAVR
jgi:hypothetical protein